MKLLRKRIKLLEIEKYKKSHWKRMKYRKIEKSCILIQTYLIGTHRSSSQMINIENLFYSFQILSHFFWKLSFS
jgi:hypothetical protein